MEANRREPQVVVEGLEQIIARDLEKHKALLEAAKMDLVAFRQARSHEIQKKRHYRDLIGGGKFDDASLERARDDMNVNIRHLSDKADLAQRAIDHETEIVDTLTEQLADQNSSLRDLAEWRKEHGDAPTN